MSDYRPSVVDIAKRQHGDRLIEFWLRAFFAFILALAVVTLYCVCGTISCALVLLALIVAGAPSQH